MSIFREKVLNKRNNQLQGDVLLNQPLPLGLVVLSIVVVFALTMIAAINLKYGRHVTAQGWFKSTPAIQDIAANQSGVLDKLLVKEGQKVIPGEVIAIVSHPDIDKGGKDKLRIELERQHQKHSELESKLDNDTLSLKERLRLISEKIQLHKRDINLLKESLNVANKNVELSRNQVERVEKTVKGNNASQAELESAQQQYLLVEQTVNDISRQIIVEEKSINELQKEKSSVNTQLLELDVTFHESKRQIEAEIDRLEGLMATVMVALIEGVVTDLSIPEGELIYAGDQLMSVVPESIEWEVEIMLPTNISANIEVGDAVRLAVSAYPYQTYGHLLGEIKAIDKSVIQSDRRLGQVSSPSFRAVVSVDSFISTNGREIKPKQGMLVTTNIITQKESVLSKILRPLTEIKEHLR